MSTFRPRINVLFFPPPSMQRPAAAAVVEVSARSVVATMAAEAAVAETAVA